MDNSRLGRLGVVERAFLYSLFQLTKNADSYGIVPGTVMDSEGRIIEVVLGTEFSDYDR